MINFYEQKVIDSYRKWKQAAIKFRTETTNIENNCKEMCNAYLMYSLIHSNSPAKVKGIIEKFEKYEKENTTK